MILKYAWFSNWLCSQLSLVKDKKNYNQAKKIKFLLHVYIVLIEQINTAFVWNTV